MELIKLRKNGAKSMKKNSAPNPIQTINNSKIKRTKRVITAVVKMIEKEPKTEVTDGG